MAEPMFEDTDKDEEVEIDDTVPGPDSFQNAELFLPHGDRTEMAKVLGRKRNAEGNFIGKKHSNPILDTRIFVVEFPDGETQDIAFNVLAEHLFSQIDEEGHIARRRSRSKRPINIVLTLKVESV
jgi:hypothetical protein